MQGLDILVGLSVDDLRFKIGAISLNVFLILSPMRYFGMLFLLWFLRIWRTSEKACSMASVSVKTGIGAVFGINSSVSVSTSFITDGL